MYLVNSTQSMLTWSTNCGNLVNVDLMDYNIVIISLVNVDLVNCVDLVSVDLVDFIIGQR